MGFAFNIPQFGCYLRSEYVHDLQSHHGEFYECVVFAGDTVSGHAIGFDCLTDVGAMFARLPISAFCWKKDAPVVNLDALELWNNYSYDAEAIEYEWLRNMPLKMLGKDRIWHPGRYMFTISWMRSAIAEGAGEGGFKRAHIIKLDNGNYAAQPNNRLRWYEASLVTKPFPSKPTFLTNSHVWTAEDGRKWVSEDTDYFFYGEGECS